MSPLEDALVERHSIPMSVGEHRFRVDCLVFDWLFAPGEFVGAVFFEN